MISADTLIDDADQTWRERRAWWDGLLRELRRELPGLPEGAEVREAVMVDHWSILVPVGACTVRVWPAIWAQELHTALSFALPHSSGSLALERVRHSGTPEDDAIRWASRVGTDALDWVRVINEGRR